MSALHSPRAESPRSDRRRRHPRRVLVVALDAAVPERFTDTDVLVVAPALNSWLRHWLSDEDSARRRAEGRAAALVEQLRPTAAHVESRVGDADPLLAIADALPAFPADEIVIATLPESATRIEEVLARARDRFPIPASGRTTHCRAPPEARGIDAGLRCLYPRTVNPLGKE